MMYISSSQWIELSHEQAKLVVSLVVWLFYYAKRNPIGERGGGEKGGAERNI